MVGPKQQNKKKSLYHACHQHHHLLVLCHAISNRFTLNECECDCLRCVRPVGTYIHTHTHTFTIRAHWVIPDMNLDLTFPLTKGMKWIQRVAVSANKTSENIQIQTNTHTHTHSQNHRKRTFNHLNRIT